uniref:Uncharacterized protein n=1 Tax=Avena sativa TaxID=4498 RepID=A0ACD5XPD9_AVESA
MVRATRGVASGAWYFEVKVLRIPPAGGTRLGWATNKADIQTPVGCDGFGFSYRSVDGTKVYKAWRAKYADEGYTEGDVLGFYISLPQGELYEPKQPDLVKYKGMPFHAQPLKDEKKTPNPVPGSEIVYFKNGVCQGTAFEDIPGGRYYPAASMYTMPDEPSCEVRFNFGPGFVFFPEDFAGRPVPRPMSEVPYQAYELKNEGPAENGAMQRAMHPNIIVDSANSEPNAYSYSGAFIKIEEIGDSGIDAPMDSKATNRVMAHEQLAR